MDDFEEKLPLIYRILSAASNIREVRPSDTIHVAILSRVLSGLEPVRRRPGILHRYLASKPFGARGD